MIRRVITAVLLVAAVAGCANYRDLAFSKDDSIRFVSPKPLTLVKLPMTLRWAVRGSPRAASYAVFVDKAPVKPGRTLRDVVRHDDACKAAGSCLDAQSLASRGVYLTADTSLQLTAVATLASHQTVQVHDAILILLDAAGRRIGEAAWDVQFKLRRTTFQ